MGEGGLAILTTYKSTGMILQVVREFPDPERCNKLPGGDCYHPTWGGVGLDLSYVEQFLKIGLHGWVYLHLQKTNSSPAWK